MYYCFGEGLVRSDSIAGYSKSTFVRFVRYSQQQRCSITQVDTYLRQQTAVLHLVIFLLKIFVFIFIFRFLLIPHFPSLSFFFFIVAFSSNFYFLPHFLFLFLLCTSTINTVKATARSRHPPKNASGVGALHRIGSVCLPLRHEGE